MNLTPDDKMSCLRIPPPVKIKNLVSSDCKYLIRIGLFMSTNENSLKSRLFFKRVFITDCDISKPWFFESLIMSSEYFFSVLLSFMKIICSK
jgi:hypothetical protein